MALTGELSDLSLAELIEFFCNQRKTGRLKVTYTVGPGYFYLQSGSVIHARIGVLRGIEAVYYALTLPNASFAFSPAFDAPEQTINQPWTSVVLEGLRRMDEGVKPGDPFPEGHHAVEEVKAEETKVAEPQTLQQNVVAESKAIPVLNQKLEKPLFKAPAADLPDMGAFLFQTDSPSRFGPWKVIAAVALVVVTIAVPWGWYARSKATRLTNEAQAPSDSVAPSTSEAADLAAKRAREARLRERAARALGPSQAVNSSVAKTQSSPAAGSKKATVQVTYDENGRVTQASGGDATALRIARQKRFPAGKPGSATITIPIN